MMAIHLVPNSSLARICPTLALNAWVYRSWVFGLHTATLYGHGFVAQGVIALVIFYTLKVILSKRRFTDVEMGELAKARPVTVTLPKINGYYLLFLAFLYLPYISWSQGMYYALVDPYVSVRSLSFIGSAIVVRVILTSLFRVRAFCQRYNFKLVMLGFDTTWVREMWLPQDETMSIEPLTAYVTATNGPEGPRFGTAPTTRVRLQLIIIHETEVATPWEDCELYCPNLLSALLVECRNNPVTIKETGRQALLRLAAPLNIPASLIPKVMEGTHSVALIAAEHPLDFLCRSSLAGGMTGATSL